MKTVTLVKCVALGLAFLVTGSQTASAASQRSFANNSGAYGCRTPRLLGTTVDRCKRDLMVLRADGCWIPIQPGYLQQVQVRVTSDGYWYWKSGISGKLERSRVCKGTTTSIVQVLWTPNKDRRIQWYAWAY